MLAGYGISVAARYTDLYNLVRRRKAMSLPASMQWDLLPPLNLKVREASSCGALEPAYDVGGDCFDHSVNGLNLDLVVMDAMGHGLGASVTSALAMGAYRHDRREGQSVATIHGRLDRVIAKQFDGETFVTGQIARLALARGELQLVNAGHPAPLLVRGGRVVGEVACRPSLPWGLGGPLEERVTIGLQPGDAVLFHTDGVVEGRSPAGEPFGVDRLVGIVERVLARGGPPPSLVQDLVGEVLSFQERRLRDDATLVWLTWDGTSA
jgi:serine phosphatase RsbU (regulator of sigma subunit)